MTYGFYHKSYTISPRSLRSLRYRVLTLIQLNEYQLKFAFVSQSEVTSPAAQHSDYNEVKSEPHGVIRIF